MHRNREAQSSPARSQTPSTYRNTSRGNREVPRSPRAEDALGRIGSLRTYADDERTREVGQTCSTCEVLEQCQATGGGEGGGKRSDQGKSATAKRVPDSGPEPPRSHAGYRMYPLSVVLRIRSIKSAQELGFSLKEIKELLSLAEDRTTDCADVRELARTKVAEICEKIQTLEAMKRALTVLAETCPGTGPAAKCSIEIKLLDMKQESIARRARELGVKRVPSVVIDGILVDCCAGRINEQTLRSAGIGSAL